MESEKTIIKELLHSAGITINGGHPWDVQIHNEKTYACVLNNGALGLGEAYMAGWWDAERLDEFFQKILSTNLEKKIKNRIPRPPLLLAPPPH